MPYKGADLIIEVNNKSIKFKIIGSDQKKNEGNLFLENIEWTVKPGKLIQDVYEVGDVIFIKKEKNFWKIKQYPKVDGGIVVLDPFNGNVLALVGGFNFKTSEFNRVTQAKRQPGSAFKPIVYAAALENGYAPNSRFISLKKKTIIKY